jgi:hypothetical protein
MSDQQHGGVWVTLTPDEIAEVDRAARASWQWEQDALASGAEPASLAAFQRSRCSVKRKSFRSPSVGAAHTAAGFGKGWLEENAIRAASIEALLARRWPRNPPLPAMSDSTPTNTGWISSAG